MATILSQSMRGRMTAVAAKLTTMITSSGTAHVGRRAMDANVSLGEKRTPKIRANEFGLGSAAGGGAGGASVVIFSPRTDLASRISSNCIGQRRKKMGNAALRLSPLPL